MASIFKKSQIPYQIVKDMHVWQLSHLAMVVPIADAYYEAKNPEKAWSERNVMLETARQMSRNFKMLHKSGIALSPGKMHLFRLLPVGILRVGLTFTFKSEFGNMFMYQHAMKAPDEMRQLHEQFYEYIKVEES